MGCSKIACENLTDEENNPRLDTKDRALCTQSGAQCAIMPWPDVLLAPCKQFTRTLVNGTGSVAAAGVSFRDAYLCEISQFTAPTLAVSV